MPNHALLRRSLTAAVGGLAIASGLIASYAAHVESHRPEVVRLSLLFPRLPAAFDGLTIAQISDLHAGKAIDADKIRRFVAATNALRPDITVVTGDMVQYFPRSARMCARELAHLRAPLGVYVILGNHERRLAPKDGEEPFRRAGLNVLCNEAHPLRSNGSTLWLIGLDDMLVRLGDLDLALHNVPEPDFKVLLVHEPDFADQAAGYPIDLQLSGHTHGGQIRLPGIGPLMLPVLGRRYPMGLYKIRDLWLYTNRGLGMAPPTVRFNCRPEITLFTLRASTPA